MGPTTSVIKICPACGAGFSCGLADCWCSAMPAVMPLPFSGDCYCPQCLAAMVAAKNDAGGNKKASSAE